MNNRFSQWCLVSLTCVMFSGCAQIIALNQSYDVQKVKKVAVLGFAGLQDFPSVGTSVFNEFNFALLQHGFNAVEPSFIQQTLADQKLEKAASIDVESIRKVGKVMGTDAVIIGSVQMFRPEGKAEVYTPAAANQSKSGAYELADVPAQSKPVSGKVEKAMISVAFRMIDVNTGEIVASGSNDAKGADGLQASKNVSRGLVKELRKQFDAVLAKRKI